MSRDFHSSYTRTSSIVATRESVSVDKEYSKRYGDQALVEKITRDNMQIVLNAAENATNIQSH